MFQALSTMKLTRVPPLYTRNLDSNLRQLLMMVMARMSHRSSSEPHRWHVSYMLTSTRRAQYRFYNTLKLLLLVSLHTRRRQPDPLYTSQVTMVMRKVVRVAEEDHDGADPRMLPIQTAW